jgi:hypothetical protein
LREKLGCLLFLGWKPSLSEERVVVSFVFLRCVEAKSLVRILKFKLDKPKQKLLIKWVQNSRKGTCP